MRAVADDVVCAGQDVTKQQFQINLVSSTDPIRVLLVNKDSNTDKPSVTPIPPPKTGSVKTSQEVSERTTRTDNAIGVLLVNKDSNADKSSVTPVPLPETLSIKTSQEVSERTTRANNSITCASEDSVNKDSETSSS